MPTSTDSARDGAPLARFLELEPGLNVMDVSGFATPMQIFVHSALDCVNAHAKDTNRAELAPQTTVVQRVPAPGDIRRHRRLHRCRTDVERQVGRRNARLSFPALPAARHLGRPTGSRQVLAKIPRRVAASRSLSAIDSYNIRRYNTDNISGRH
jgi:hypothetical protein